MRKHVLDASALYRYLMKGDGAEIVIQVFKGAAAGGYCRLDFCRELG